MNAEVVTVSPAISNDNVPVLNRHMAESSIQTATSSKTLDDCDNQLMSLWRPIMCRTSQMFPPPAPPTRTSSSVATDLSVLTGNMSSYFQQASQSGDVVKAAHQNNNNKNCLHPNNNNNKIDAHQMAHPVSVASPTTIGKSIPVHCVVMNTTTPCYLADAAMISTPSASGGIEGGASTPTKATCNSGHQAEESVDVDSYAIIPASTLFNQIVPVVLRKLGYTEDVIFNATGWLMMKNWRPLSLTQIASSERETVGGVLGELTTVATLRIYVRRNYSSSVSNHQSEMKNKVLRWLMTQSQHLINNTRFPLDEKWQQKVMRGERPATPSADARRQFDVWFQQEMLRPSPPTPTQQHQQQQQQHLMMTRSSNEKMNHQQRHSPSSNNDQQPPGSENNNNVCMSTGLHSSSSSSQLSRDVSAVASSAVAPRVRMRTTFDPEQELPRLQRWFAENQHPTRFQLQLYVQELNELESRRGRKPLDVSNLVYWFKNARAAFKRAEVRGGNHHLTGGRESNGSWMTTGHSMREGMHLSSSGRLAGEEEEEEEESCDGDRHRLRRRRHHRMMAEEEDPVDDEEEEDMDDDDEDEDANSSVSDRSRRSFSSTHPSSVLPLKLEPLDLNRSSSCDERDTKIHHENNADEPEEQAMDAVMQPSALPLNGVDDAGADLDDGDDIGSQASADSDSELEDYAENLSLSKHPSDGMADGSHHKKVDPLLQHNTSGSSSSQDYAAAAAAAAATSGSSGGGGGYSGFSGLNLSHAQLNPHGLVYMTSPYLQGIGSSLLHHQSAAAAAAAAAAAGLAHHLHHHQSSSTTSSSRGAIGMDPLSLTSSSSGVGNCSDDRRKRNRTFIDPVTEVPRLEQWFSLNTHPSHSLVLRYTDELNRQPYRLKFPKLEPKNVQFWFKNRRAKCKRLKLSL